MESFRFERLKSAIQAVRGHEMLHRRQRARLFANNAVPGGRVYRLHCTVAGDAASAPPKASFVLHDSTARILKQAVGYPVPGNGGVSNQELADVLELIHERGQLAGGDGHAAT